MARVIGLNFHAKVYNVSSLGKHQTLLKMIDEWIGCDYKNLKLGSKIAYTPSCFVGNVTRSRNSPTQLNSVLQQLVMRQLLLVLLFGVGLILGAV